MHTQKLLYGLLALILLLGAVGGLSGCGNILSPQPGGEITQTGS